MIRPLVLSLLHDGISTVSADFTTNPSRSTREQQGNKNLQTPNRYRRFATTSRSSPTHTGTARLRGSIIHRAETSTQNSNFSSLLILINRTAFTIAVPVTAHAPLSLLRQQYLTSLELTTYFTPNLNRKLPTTVFRASLPTESTPRRPQRGSHAGGERGFCSQELLHFQLLNHERRKNTKTNAQPPPFDSRTMQTHAWR